MTRDPFELAREPDLVVGDLRIWVSGREFPQALDYWDGNWLHVHAIVECGGSSVMATGAFLHLADIDRFHREVQALVANLSGTASLNPMEPNLKVELVGNGRGQIKLVIKLTPDHLSESHEFRDELDQTFLSEFVRACRVILEQYPIREPQTMIGTTGTVAGSKSGA